MDRGFAKDWSTIKPKAASGLHHALLVLQSLVGNWFTTTSLPSLLVVSDFVKLNLCHKSNFPPEMGRHGTTIPLEHQTTMAAMTNESGRILEILRHIGIVMMKQLAFQHCMEELELPFLVSICSTNCWHSKWPMWHVPRHPSVVKAQIGQEELGNARKSAKTNQASLSWIHSWLTPGIRTVHAWIPLKAMGKELGTLRYLIGTHRREHVGCIGLRMFEEVVGHGPF